mmetsp:Transcript_118075/g.329139  ORF Transcript_118075/g.329139 Transcript_118075/m.329139 type:complete len:208 (-) Transcript_118075:917-1540(-)
MALPLGVNGARWLRSETCGRRKVGGGRCPWCRGSSGRSSRGKERRLAWDRVGPLVRHKLGHRGFPVSAGLAGGVGGQAEQRHLQPRLPRRPVEAAARPRTLLPRLLTRWARRARLRWHASRRARSGGVRSSWGRGAGHGRRCRLRALRPLRCGACALLVLLLALLALALPLLVLVMAELAVIAIVAAVARKEAATLARSLLMLLRAY